MTRDPSIAPNRVTCHFLVVLLRNCQFDPPNQSSVALKSKFPRTFEDYGNVIKFFARYDPPKVLDIFKTNQRKIGKF